MHSDIADDHRPPARYIDDETAAAVLGLSASYLRKLRVYGGGPRFYTLGAKAIRYRESDLHSWAEGRAATSTSERAAA